jgi:simple sugar transport system ATP-binding protein/ribose transport system ATP-binding protein
MADSPHDTHIELCTVSKHFGGVQALTDINVRVARGTVHALVGENGAGKSTLGKICGGIISPDSGQVLVDGEPVGFRSPRDALDHGIATIAQELALVPGLTVAQNVFLGSEPRSAGFVLRRSLARRFDKLAAAAGFGLAPGALVGSLRLADQQKVEIMRALSRDATTIIMDEPSAALSHQDVETLHDLIRSLAAAGRTVLLVSHFLSEVLSLSDTVTILRDGQHVRTSPAAAETESSLIEGMLGRSLGSVFPPKSPAPGDEAPTVLAVTSITAPGVHDVSLRVRAGEIVGIAGLVGAGRSELAHAITGATRRQGGTVSMAGEAVTMTSPRAALRQGVVLIPESRKTQGLVPHLSVAENVTLANLPSYSAGGLLRRGRQHKAASSALASVNVKGAGLGLPVAALSGGNQQKTLFARAMLCRPKVLIADEPTRGVDVGSRRGIYDLIAEQAAAGVGVVVISSDVEEVIGLSHRLVVMRGGRVSAELEGEQMTEANTLRAAFQEPAR